MKKQINGRSFTLTSRDNELKQLTPRHAAYLRNRGISKEVILSRGYYSIENSRDLPELLKGEWTNDQKTTLDYKENAALVMPLHNSFDRSSPSTYHLRFDTPRETSTNTSGKSKFDFQTKPIKFELPSGIVQGNELGDLPADIHPLIRNGKLTDESSIYFITEGACKADALLTAARNHGYGIVPVALTGVTMGYHAPETKNNHGKKHVLTAALDSLPLEGREVVLAWDADAATKPQIAASLVRTADLLTAKGATVTILAVPVLNGDAKTGIDDWLAENPTKEDFLSLQDLCEPVDRFRLIAKNYADSDAGRGLRLSDELERLGNYRFVAKSDAKNIGDGSWLRFDGARLTAQDAVTEIHNIALELTKRDSVVTAHQSKRALDHARLHSTTSKRLIIHPNELDRAASVLATAKGQLINLHTGTFRPTTAADCITKATSVGVDFNQPIPMFEHFLDQITMFDDEMKKFLQVMIGMVLLGEVTEEKLFMLYGEGKNGKSTFMKIILAILGDELSVVLRGDKLGVEMPDSTIAALRGARLAIGDDALGDDIRAATIKRLSSSDKLTGRFLYESSITFDPSHTTILYANRRPKIDVVGKAVWRRLVVIPFDLRIATEDEKATSDGRVIAPDAELDRKIVAAEGEGILAWAVEGAREFIQNGRQLPECARVTAMSKTYQQEEDIVQTWISEYCIIGDDEENNGNELLEHFQYFTELEYGFPTKKSLASLKKELGEKFDLTIIRNRKGKRVWKGISLTQAAVDEFAMHKNSNRGAAA